jgi:hypothetical protein
MIRIRARLQACRTLRKRTSALAAAAEQIPAAEADSCRIAFDGIAEAKP